MSLQQLATTCKALLFYFIAVCPYNCNKIFHASYFILFYLFILLVRRALCSSTRPGFKKHSISCLSASVRACSSITEKLAKEENQFL